MPKTKYPTSPRPWRVSGGNEGQIKDACDQEVGTTSVAFQAATKIDKGNAQLIVREVNGADALRTGIEDALTIINDKQKKSWLLQQLERRLRRALKDAK